MFGVDNVAGEFAGDVGIGFRVLYVFGAGGIGGESCHGKSADDVRAKLSTVHSCYVPWRSMYHD